MISFLTSYPFFPDGTMNPANGFADELRASLPQQAKALFVCSDPDNPERTDYYAAAVREGFAQAGFAFDSFAVFDRRAAGQAGALVREADLIILTGGHVPTQNRFFLEIHLRSLLQGWNGVLIGMSAGSMNSAETVYSQPEEPGEAVNPAYRRFLPGLGLTKAMILPHLQSNRDDVLDGLRIYEDIAFPDSMGRTFYAIPDGSYLLNRDGEEEMRGEAWRIRDGQMTQVSAHGETVRLE